MGLMEESVKLSIEGRKNAIFNAYEVPDNMQARIKELFNKIEELGKSCKDSADFEAKFASGPLNAEYTQLFTDLAMSGAKCKFGPAPGEIEEVDQAEVAKDLAKDYAEMEVEGAAQSVRGRAYRAAESKVRDIPVIGDAIDMKRKIDFFTRFKKEEDEE